MPGWYAIVTLGGASGAAGARSGGPTSASATAARTAGSERRSDMGNPSREKTGGRKRIVSTVANAFPMGVILTEPVAGSVAWSGGELKPDDSWVYRLGDADLLELETAISSSRARRPVVELVTRADFPLPALGAKLIEIAARLEDGRGLFWIRGFPVERWSEDDAARALWGLGTYLGRAIPQNARGDLVGHVRYDGLELSDPHARGYQTRAAQSLHVDRCDVVGLLCMKKAKSGGLSRVVSSIRVYNEMLARCPWHLGMLYAPFAIDMRGEEDPGEPPVYYRPVFSYYGGKLSCGANRQYVDYPAAERMRHMLRLWLAMPNARPLAPDFGTYDFAARRVVGIRA